ncbi:uncharacterized protein ACRADG_010704 [Cochliomyia hominivorax]
MDTHSKNVLIIGVLHILGYIIFSIEPLITGTTMLNFVRDGLESSRSSAIFNFVVVGFFAVMALFAGLMIHGVKKRNHLLIAPFLITSVFNLATMVIIFFMHSLDEYKDEPYTYEDSLYKLGFQIIILYPICTLFTKLRSQNKKSLSDSTSEHKEKTLEDFKQKLCV